MTPDEMRAARGLLGISIDYLSAQTGLDILTLDRFEDGWSVDVGEHTAIITYFEKEGVSFLSKGVGYATSTTLHGVSMFFMKSIANLSVRRGL